MTAARGSVDVGLGDGAEPPARALENPFFRAWGRLVVRHRWLLLALTTLTTAVAGWGAMTGTRFESGIGDVDPGLNAGQRTLERYEARFGRDSPWLVVATGDVFDAGFLRRLAALRTDLERLTLDGEAGSSPAARPIFEAPFSLLDTWTTRFEEGRPHVEWYFDPMPPAVALTTMVGLLSFRPAGIGIIRDMGVSAAIGVALTLLHIRSRGTAWRSGRSRPRYAASTASATPGDLWELLVEGRERLRDLDDDDPRRAGVSRETARDPRDVRRGAVLDGVDLFDSERFGYGPRDAERMDSQTRLLYECAWEVLEDGGLEPRDVEGESRCCSATSGRCGGGARSPPGGAEVAPSVRANRGARAGGLVPQITRSSGARAREAAPLESKTDPPDAVRRRGLSVRDGTAAAERVIFNRGGERVVFAFPPYLCFAMADVERQGWGEHMDMLLDEHLEKNAALLEEVFEDIYRGIR